MNYKQCRNVFPNIEAFRSPARVAARLFALDKNMLPDHVMVLAKLAELCGDQWPLDVLQWLYLIKPAGERQECIDGYKEIISGLEAGEIEIGDLKEAFEEKGDLE